MALELFSGAENRWAPAGPESRDFWASDGKHKKPAQNLRFPVRCHPPFLLDCLSSPPLRGSKMHSHCAHRASVPGRVHRRKVNTRGSNHADLRVRKWGITFICGNPADEVAPATNGLLIYAGSDGTSCFRPESIPLPKTKNTKATSQGGCWRGFGV